jgi:hypothetical protein
MSRLNLDNGAKFATVGTAVSVIFMGILSKFDVTFDDGFQAAVAVVVTFLFGLAAPLNHETPPEDK